ncbi:MAG: hypothetical protein Q8M65_05785 [Rhodoglobus sp.]|nr:hypothetical protein [Rhodoglobus sp.]
MSRINPTVFVALLAVSLTACTVPGGDPAVDAGSPSDDALGTSTMECLTQGTWVLDVALSGVQLGELLAEQGQRVVSSTGSGRETLQFRASGEFANSVDVSYVIVSLTEGGDEVTVVQTHSGNPTAVFALQPDQSTVLLSGWDLGGSRVQTEAIVGGSSTGVQDLPVTGVTPGAILTQCDSGGLVTQTEGSPVRKHWSLGG